MYYITMFPYFSENRLISESQSGFKAGDFCVKQLLAITLEYFPKAFDNVWHKEIIYKVKCNGISVNLLSLLTVVLKGWPRLVLVYAKVVY